MTRKPVKKTRGKPTVFSKARAQEIIDLVLEERTIREICSLAHMPTKPTLFKWLDDNPDFRDTFEHAKQFLADILIDDIKEIADDARNDFMMTKKGPKLNKEAVMRSKLRVDARFRLAEKLFPRRFGSKVTQEITGAEGKPIEIDQRGDMSDIEVARRIAYLLDRGFNEIEKAG